MPTIRISNKLNEYIAIMKANGGSLPVPHCQFVDIEADKLCSIPLSPTGRRYCSKHQSEVASSRVRLSLFRLTLHNSITTQQNRTEANKLARLFKYYTHIERDLYGPCSNIQSSLAATILRTKQNTSVKHVAY